MLYHNGRVEVVQALSNPDHPAVAMIAACRNVERYRASVADDKLWTAAELERLTPDERHRVINEGVVTDLDQLPPDFLARIRAKGRALLEERGIVAPPCDGG